MAYATFGSWEVFRACTARLESIKEWRERRVNEAIEALMQQTKFSFMKMKRVPLYASEKEAMAHLKDGSKDFWGSPYSQIMSAGCIPEQKVKDLRELANKSTSDIQLADEEVKLLANHLTTKKIN